MAFDDKPAQSGSTQLDGNPISGAVQKTHINLISEDGSDTRWFAVPQGATQVSVQIVINDDGTTTRTWTSAVVTAQWSNNAKDATTYATSITFDTDNQSRANIPVSGVKFFRLATTTAEGASDEKAAVYLNFT